MTKLILILSMFIFISACQTPEVILKKYQDKWAGHTISDAVAEYGPADKTADVEDGRVYEWTRQGDKNMSINSYGNSTSVNSSQRRCTIRLRADKTGKINYVSWTGNDC